MNIDEIRKDTPGCASKIHFNNAGASLPTSAVTDAIRDYISFESLTGGYEAADIKKAEIQEFYNSAARLVNTHETDQKSDG